jgi:dihydrofolate synthase/folylpolyglutamate synthase
MADKDARGLLEVFEETMSSVVVTTVASTSRAMPAEALGELAAEVFGAERVTVAPRLDDALEAAVAQAEVDGAGSPGVLVTGSVVLVGEARALLVTDEPASDPERPTDPDDDWDTEFGEDDAEAGDAEGDDPYGGFGPQADRR